MNRKIAMLMVSLLAALPCAVHAQVVLASHTGSTTNLGGLGREFAPPANQFNHAWGQTFTPTASATLATVTVNLLQAQSLNLRMDFYDYTADPTLSSRLATVTLPAASLTGGAFHDVSFDFSGAAVSLTASNVYAYVLSTPPDFNPPTSGNEDNFEDYYFTGTTDNSYAGGSQFFDFNYNNAAGTSSGTLSFGIGIVDSNFSVTSIPEPSTTGALVGLAGLALVLSRRRRQHTV